MKEILLTKDKVAIGFQGKYIRVGRYFDIHEAALAYNKVAVMYFGEKAKLNKVKK